jgi:hypothetical protein
MLPASGLVCVRDGLIGGYGFVRSLVCHERQSILTEQKLRYYRCSIFERTS